MLCPILHPADVALVVLTLLKVVLIPEMQLGELLQGDVLLTLPVHVGTHTCQAKAERDQDQNQDPPREVASAVAIAAAVGSAHTRFWD